MQKMTDFSKHLPIRADDIDDYEADSRPGRGKGMETLVLPTAPRASLGPNISDDRIPKYPPFTAYIANLSYEIEDEDVYKFFGNLNVTNIRLQREGEGDKARLKGYGYADFGDRASLVEALSMHEQMLKNRKIKIDISNSSNDRSSGFGDRRGGGRMDNRRHDDDGEDRTAGDWRSGGGLPAFRDDDRDRDRGGFDRYDRGGGRDRGFEDRRSYERGNTNQGRKH